MKAWFRWIFVALLGHAAIVAAAGPSHEAERIFYYMVYLAEEVFVPSGQLPQYTIAPGCSGSRANGRCTFFEFLLFIWSDNNGPRTRAEPTGIENWNGILDNLLEDHSVGELSLALAAARCSTGTAQPPQRQCLSGFMSPAALCPGEQSKSYVKALKYMGQRIFELQNLLGTTQFTEIQQLIMSLAKDAIQSAAELRMMDVERFRIPAVTRMLGYKPSTTLYYIRAGFNIQFELLNPDKDDKALNKAIKQYMISNIMAKRHMPPLRASMMAGARVGCKFRF